MDLYESWHTSRLHVAIRDRAGNMGYAVEDFYVGTTNLTNGTKTYQYDAAGCLTNLNGITLDSVSLPVAVGPYSICPAIKLAKNFAMALKPFDSFVSMELVSDPKVIARNKFYYAPEKYLNNLSEDGQKYIGK